MLRLEYVLQNEEVEEPAVYAELAITTRRVAAAGTADSATSLGRDFAIYADIDHTVRLAAAKQNKFAFMR